MILNNLEKIKSFGCQLESNITPEEIEKKEAELGCELPIALKEFYMTFNEKDPIFSSNGKFFPLNQLKITCGEIWTVEEDKMLWKSCKAVVFLEERVKLGNWGLAYMVDDENSANPRCMFYKTFVENRKKKHTFSPARDFPLMDKFSSYLLFRIGESQLNCQPYVIRVTYDILQEADCPKRFSDKLEMISAPPENPSLIHGYTKKFNLFTRFLDENEIYVAIPNPQLTKRYINYLEADKFSWYRRGGKFVNSPKVRKQIKPRPLNSILPTIERFKNFFNITEGGYPESLLAEAETRLGLSFMLPLRELYLNIPQSRLEESSNFISPKELELYENDKKKVEFLWCEQGIPEFAFEADSPIVYQLDDCEDKWEAYEVMDGFLVAELLWSLMNQPYLNDKYIAVGSWEECPKRALTPKGKLGKYLVSDTQKLTKGNIRHLYHSPEGDILALYDSEAKELYLVAKSDEIMLKLEEATGIDLVLW